jgi:hypothetical protein
MVLLRGNHFLDQSAHGLETQRQRDHVEQQPVVTGGAISRQQIGLDRRPQGHHLVWIEIVERLLAEELADGMLDLRHARGAAHHHHAFDVFRRQAGIAQCLASRHQGLLHQGTRDFGEDVGRQRHIDILSAAELNGNRRFAMLRKVFLGFPRPNLQQAHIVRR